MDYFDVIVHVMHTETRLRYDLEGLWGDAKPVKAIKAKAVKSAKPEGKPAKKRTPKN